jgi:hypothetical protein
MTTPTPKNTFWMKHAPSPQRPALPDPPKGVFFVAVSAATKKTLSRSNPKFGCCIEAVHLSALGALSVQPFSFRHTSLQRPIDENVLQDYKSDVTFTYGE